MNKLGPTASIPKLRWTTCLLYRVLYENRRQADKTLLNSIGIPKSNSDSDGIMLCMRCHSFIVWI